MANDQMKKKLPMLRLSRSKERFCAGFLPLVILLMLGGCAVGVNVQPDPTADSPQITAGPTVTRFADGRKGFVITEQVTLDADRLRDFNQAVDFLNKGDIDQAIELLKKVIEASPGVTAPYINLAIAYGKDGKPEMAEDSLKTALQLVPGHPVASNEYGLLLRKAGRFAEVRKVYEQALTLFPEYLPVRRNLGILCDLYLNDQECALAQYEHYNEADPGDAQVKLWISELRLRHGQ